MPNRLKHLFIREKYGYTNVKGQEHEILLNRNISQIPIELL